MQRTWPEIWSTLRVHHAIRCISSFYGACRFGARIFGSLSVGSRLPNGFPLQGLSKSTEERGLFLYSNEQGAHIGVIWSAPGAIGLVFDKDSAESEAAGGRVSPADYRPLRFFESLPDDLTDLGRNLAKLIGNLATAGFCLPAGQPLWESTYDSIDTHDWFRLLDGPRGPLADLEVYSLDEEHGELAVAIATRSLLGPTELTADELRTLLTLPSEWAEEDDASVELTPDEEVMSSLRTELARIDVHVPV